MPNDLTQTFSKSVPRPIGRNKKSNNLNDMIEDDQLSSMDQIRQDLDDADNVFGVLYANKPLRRKRGSIDQIHQTSRSQDDLFDERERPSVEWLPSSGDECANVNEGEELKSLRDRNGKIRETKEILNMTGVKDLHQMEKLREKLRNLEKLEPNNHQHVLNR